MESKREDAIASASTESSNVKESYRLYPSLSSSQFTVAGEKDKGSGCDTSTKSKFDDPKLDPTWLYSTLRKEINKEASYQLENDAKIRAVTQGTLDYEQFRQMVLGAHIRPLERNDKVQGMQNGKKAYVTWNTVVNDNIKGSQKATVKDDPFQEDDEVKTVFSSTNPTTPNQK